MDNFDLKKYLAEGKLLKEAFYPEFEGETNDKINDIAIAVVDELESKLDSESSGILKGMDYYVGSDGMDNDEVEQGFTKWFIDLVKYLSKNNNEVTISSVEQDGKVFTPAITLKYLDNGKEDISWKLKRDLAEGKLLKEEMKAPSGWTEIKDLSDIHYSEEDGEIAVKAWDAPMEGWDEEHKDMIIIRKDNSGFYLDGYVSFGDFEMQGPFNTYEEVFKLAVEEMEAFKEDWDEQ